MQSSRVVHQSSFFENQALLKWLPGETFFSLVSRHHRVWGHSVAHWTAEQLFGYFQGGAHDDFPSNLGECVTRTSEPHELKELPRRLVRMLGGMVRRFFGRNARKLPRHVRREFGEELLRGR